MIAALRTCVVSLIIGAAILPASVADVPALPAAYAAPAQPLSIVSEVRIGGAVQDPGSAEGKLPGSSKANVNGEILFAKPQVSADPFWQAFV
ncbi:acyloxyacyl hydrolase, partial [Methylobacterium mesophilicum]